MFTDTAIKKLLVKPAAYREFDSCGIPGFGVKVYPSGTKTFELRVYRDGKSKYYRLGECGKTPLAAAREKARVILSRLDQGLPALDDAKPPPGATFEALLLAWQVHQQGLARRNLGMIEQLIRANVPPALLAKPAKLVTATDIRDVLAVVHQRGSRVLANRLRAHLHSLFNYGLQADHDPRRLSDPVLFGIEVNPVTAIPRDAGAEQPRDRVLSWAEVREVWHSDTLTWPARQACRLLLLTGARVNEIAQAAWSEFNLEAGLWTLPAARSKNHRELLTPLLPMALAALHELREVWPDSAWLFPARNVGGSDKPWGMTALSHAVRNAQNELPRNPQQLSCQGILDNWKPQDLRRTFKTLAAGAGIGRDILDRLQNHAAQDVASRHYDRFDYQREKRAALATWERELSGRVIGENVITLPVKRRA